MYRKYLAILSLGLVSAQTFAHGINITPQDNTVFIRYTDEPLYVSCKKKNIANTVCVYDCGNGSKITNTDGYCRYSEPGTYTLRAMMKDRRETHVHNAQVKVSKRQHHLQKRNRKDSVNRTASQGAQPIIATGYSGDGIKKSGRIASVSPPANSPITPVAPPPSSPSVRPPVTTPVPSAPSSNIIGNNNSFSITIGESDTLNVSNSNMIGNSASNTISGNNLPIPSPNIPIDRSQNNLVNNAALNANSNVNVNVNNNFRSR